ncbi:hypothetical protein RchiOBHm_Chr1g0341161 [Rosa chinensis]|uniref:Uncharacterized protein n=1 Tax=Rosa chinensis TaxID=74649 RepID=A0A2P6SDM9_ROSCH|nr:hypothetical protein RchiOBHm_Chr1g0341161 [Rosa chinensis]
MAYRFYNLVWVIISSHSNTLRPLPLLQCCTTTSSKTSAQSPPSSKPPTV